MARVEFERKTIVDASGNTIGAVNNVSGNGVKFLAATEIGDAQSGLFIANGDYIFNGTNWDRVRNNTEGTLLASAARTASVNSPLQTNYNAKGVHVTLNVTVASGTGGLIVKILGLDQISGNYYQLNANGTAISATGTYSFEVYPGTGGTVNALNGWMNQSTQHALPRSWVVQVTTGDSSSYTYSIGYSLIL